MHDTLCKKSMTQDTTSHLINRSRWQSQRFWLVARRFVGRIPAAGCNRRSNDAGGQKIGFSVPCFASHRFSSLPGSKPSSPPRVFVRWLVISDLRHQIRFPSVKNMLESPVKSKRTMPSSETTHVTTAPAQTHAPKRFLFFVGILSLCFAWPLYN